MRANIREPLGQLFAVIETKDCFFFSLQECKNALFDVITVSSHHLGEELQLVQEYYNLFLVCISYSFYILYFIIVRERFRSISETIAARGLKFWLQVALSALIAPGWAEIRNSGSGSGKSGFSKIRIFVFFASMDLS